MLSCNLKQPQALNEEHKQSTDHSFKQQVLRELHRVLQKKKKRGKWSYSALALEAFALLLTSRGGGAFRIQLPDAGSNLIAVWTIPPAQTMQTVSFTATVAVWGGVLSQRERAHRSFPGPPHQILIIPLIDFSFE